MTLIDFCAQNGLSLCWSREYADKFVAEIDGLAFTKNQTLHGEGAAARTAINDLTDKISDKAVFYKNNALCVPKLSHVTNDIDFICKQTTPPHDGTTRVLDYVLADLKSRAEMGKEKYGHYLETNNGRNALQDAYEEALDMCMYLKQKLLEDKNE